MPASDLPARIHRAGTTGFLLALGRAGHNRGSGTRAGLSTDLRRAVAVLADPGGSPGGGGKAFWKEDAALVRACQEEPVVRSAESVVIARPAGEVFDYVADLRNEPKWHVDVSSVPRETDRVPVVGRTYPVKFKPFIGQDRWLLSLPASPSTTSSPKPPYSTSSPAPPSR